MIIDTTAIVLKTVAFSESSLIVTLLTEKHGKLAVMARGARRSKNRFGGLLQPGAILDTTYYYKTTRDVQNLSEATQNRPTWRIHQHIEKMALGLVTLELCEQLCHEFEPMPEISSFLKDFLGWLHDTSSNTRCLFPYIQFRLAQHSGIAIAWEVDESPGQSVSDSSSGNEPNTPFACYLNVESGSIARLADGGLSFGLTKSQHDYIRYIVEGRKSMLLAISFPASDIRNLIHHLDAYFQFHLGGIRERRSDAIFQQIL